MPILPSLQFLARIHHGRAGLLFAFASLTAFEAIAHGGGLNAQGCHNNRKTGDYHCHRASRETPPAPDRLVSQERERTPQTNPGEAQPDTLRQDSVPARPTCFTGPRGGTYTITASGKKNYGGC